MKRKFYFLSILMAIKLFTYGQIGINATNTAPNGSAMLDVSSTNKGLLIPRMTTIQKNAIPNKIEGLTVYDTDLKQFSYWTINGAIGSWNNFGAGSSGGSSTWSLIGNDISNTNTGNVFIGPGINTANARLYVKKGEAGSTALFEGSSLTSAFNYGENEDTYIRGGKTNSHVLINDGTLGNVGIGPIIHPTLGTNEPRLAKLMVADGPFRTGRTSAMFGSNYRGIALMFDNPAIGFNSFFNSASYLSRSIQAGHGRNIEMFDNGTLDFQYYGQAPSPFYGFEEIQSHMAIQANGNVGIGNIATDAKLSISGSPQPNSNSHVLTLQAKNPVLHFNAESGTNLSYIKGVTDNALHPQYTGGGIDIGSIPGGFVYLSSGYAPGLVLNNMLNVGIGTLTPQHKLDIVGNFRLQGTDFKMGPVAGRGNGGRAIVLDNNNMLSINYANDFSGGTYINSNVGVGTLPSSTYKLSVNGTIRSKELIVESGWADYVFDDKYKLRSLKEVDRFIELNKHLPGVPSALEVQANGIKLSETTTILMEKIEELTLYLIKQDNEIENLKKIILKK